MSDSLNADIVEATAKLDPAPRAQDLAYERLSELLAKITNGTLDELRILRDQIDDLMRAIQARDKALKEAFMQHTQYACDVLNTKQVIGESVQHMTKTFNAGLPPLGQTVTAGK